MIKNFKITLDDFEDWLNERGYARMMGKENLRVYLNNGLASLFFSNSNLLMSCIFSKLGLPSERVADRIKIEIGKKVRKVYADKYMIELEIEVKE